MILVLMLARYFQKKFFQTKRARILFMLRGNLLNKLTLLSRQESSKYIALRDITKLLEYQVL